VFRLSSCHQPTARRSRLARVPLVALLLASLAASACGSSQPDSGAPPLSSPSSLTSSAVPTSSAPPESPSFATELPSTATPEPTTAIPEPSESGLQGASSIGGTAENGQGDRVHLTITFDAPAPASEVLNTVIDSCRSAVAAANSSFERSLAVTVRVTMEVTSALPTTVVLKLGDHAQAIGGGQTEPAHGVRLWAKNYSTGPTCGSSISNVKEAASIQWADAAPNRINRWTGWLILAGGITPSDPTGSQSSLGGLLISPHVTLAGSSTTITYLQQESPHLVSCSADDAAAGNVNYVAVRPDDAQRLGCGRAG
jgi:hypothetical protein